MACKGQLSYPQLCSEAGVQRTARALSLDVIVRRDLSV